MSAAPRKPLRREQVEVGEWRHGEALADLAGSPVALFGAAPGDRLEVLAAKRRKGVHPGWVAQVQHSGAGRVEPRCPHFGACGGCSGQHLAYSHQLLSKAVPLEAALRARGAEIRPAVAAPSPFYYRSKVELSFDARGQLGFNRRRRFDQVVDVEECFLAAAGNREILAALRNWKGERTGWNARTHEGQLRYLVLRHAFATGQWLAVLVTTPGVDVGDLGSRLVELGATGVLRVEQTSVAGAIVPEREELLAGRPQIEERLGELRFELSWRSFFQSNPPAYRKMLDVARDWLGPVDRLLDLFCGIGTIGLYLGPSRLVGVESVEPAIVDARLNAVRNGLSGEFHCAPAQDWPDLECDVLVLDPPRSGCHPKLLQRVQSEGPARILYVSCNPTRLEAELDQLSAYRLVRAQLFDFFPQTRHVEALTLLERA